MLEKTSVKIVGEATDAPGTLTLAKKHKPAVVLLDAAIPGGDSFETDYHAHQESSGDQIHFALSPRQPDLHGPRTRCRGC